MLQLPRKVASKVNSQRQVPIAVVSQTCWFGLPSFLIPLRKQERTTEDRNWEYLSNRPACSSQKESAVVDRIQEPTAAIVAAPIEYHQALITTEHLLVTARSLKPYQQICTAAAWSQILGRQ